MRINTFSLFLFSFIWLSLVGAPSSLADYVFAVFIPILCLLLAIKLSLIPSKFHLKLSAFYYIIWLIKEIILSTTTVIKIAWRRNLQIHPVMLPIESIQTTDIGRVLYANSITLTPGTVTLSVYANIMMIHALDTQLMDDLEQGKMDKMVREIIK